MNTYIVNIEDYKQVTVRADYFMSNKDNMLTFYRMMNRHTHDEYEDTIAIFKAWEHVYLMEGE